MVNKASLSKDRSKKGWNPQPQNKKSESNKEKYVKAKSTKEVQKTTEESMSETKKILQNPHLASNMSPKQKPPKKKVSQGENVGGYRRKQQ